MISKITKRMSSWSDH